jgi:clorobiocin biosynthesis protein CloN4
VLDVYGAFATGASVHLVSTTMSHTPWELVDFVARHGITIWYSVPSALILMMTRGGPLDRQAPASLRGILFEGEPFPMRDLRRLAAWTSARLLNLYGPTETNVCTAREIAAADPRRSRPVPIGTAVCGDRVWTVTPEGVVSGPAECGELVVDGATVMLGYWGEEPRRGPYHTGDPVEVLPDGSFDYGNRLDQLVKVRGHRVSPGEVEAALLHAQGELVPDTDLLRLGVLDSLDTTHPLHQTDLRHLGAVHVRPCVSRLLRRASNSTGSPSTLMPLRRSGRSARRSPPGRPTARR